MVRHQPGWQSIPVGRPAACLLLLFVMVLGTLFLADAAGAAVIDTSKDRWGLLGGYGQSFPGWGQTTERVESIDLVPRYNHLVVTEIGSGWYRGSYSLLVELPVHLVLSPDVASMIGMNFLACYSFTTGQVMRPYLFGGGGPVYNFADIPGVEDGWNGNYQFGVGLAYEMTRSHSLLFEVRYHHLSNGGREEPNVPLNSVRLLFGITF